MKFSREDFDVAAEQLSPEQREQFWTSLASTEKSEKILSLQVVAAIIGVLVVLVSMSSILEGEINSLSGIGITVIGIIQGVVFSYCGYYLWFRKKLRIPGGLLIAIAVYMAPVVLAGILKVCGAWVPEFKDPKGNTCFLPNDVLNRWNLVIMGLGTIAASCVALKYVKFPLLMVPALISLKEITNYIAPIFIGKIILTKYESDVMTGGFGLALIIASLVVEKIAREDYSKWLSLVGIVLFSYAMFSIRSITDEEKLRDSLIMVGMMGFGLVLRRWEIVIIAGVGCLPPIFLLTSKLLTYATLHPYFASLVGILMIFSGFVYQRNRAAFDGFLSIHLPWNFERIRKRE